MADDWLLHALADNGTMVWETDLATRLTTTSPSAMQLWGFNGGTAQQYIDRIHAADRERVQAAWWAAVEKGEAYRIQYRVHAPDGRLRWYVSSGRVDHDAEGRPAKLMGVTTDITAQREAEEAVRGTQASFRHLADAMPHIVWVANRHADNIYLNQAWTAFTGLPADAGMGPRWRDTVHPDDLPAIDQGWAGSQREQRPYEVDYRLRMADGRYQWFRASAVPVLDAHGGVDRWYGCSSNVDQLKRSTEALLEADTRKDHFLAVLSHELRSPLAPIQNALEVLRRTPQDAVAQDRMLGIITRQTAQLSHLVDELLDLSRISTGKLALHRAELTLQDVVRDAVEAVQPHIEARGHRLVLDLPDAPVPLHGDRGRLTQAVSNVLHNAVKYTDDGGRIALTVSRRGGDAMVTIEDNGIGIPATLLDTVFDLFAQASLVSDRSAGGLGIGLHLVRRILALHGGQIEAHSAGTGLGSRFTLRLPLPSYASEPQTSTSTWASCESAGATPSYEAQGLQQTPLTAQEGSSVCEGGSHPCRVLVVDDNADAAATMAELLGLMGHEVRTANDGETALLTAESFQPQVALLDIGLPGLSGYEVCKRIRQAPWGRDMTLIACTGWGQESSKRASSDAGFDKHLVKPVDPAEVMRTLQSVEGRSHLA